MTSSSSGSSSDSSNFPAPERKKIQVEIDSESSDGSDDRDSSDTNSVAEEHSDVPRPLFPTEVTVLSHAERRRQKKRQKQNQPAVTSESEFPRKKRKLDDGTGVLPPSKVDPRAKTKEKKTTTDKAKAKDQPSRQKHQNSVWVGNLSFRTTEDTLRVFFNGVGTITRVHMPMRRGIHMQGENMGFAYVDFETLEAKVIAITLSEGQLDGRNLLIKDGDDFTGRPPKAKTEPSERTGGYEGSTGEGLSKRVQKLLHAQKQPPAPTLFLGNLGFETTEESIRELFEAHRYLGHKDKRKEIDVKAKEVNQSEGQGEDVAKPKDVWIRNVRMGTFEDSGACKGFAFVDFTSIEHATNALIDLRNHRLNGRNLVVEYASPDAVRRGGGGPRHPKGDRDQKSRTGNGSAPQKRPANAPYTKSPRPQPTEEDGAEATKETTGATTPQSRRPERASHGRPDIRRAKPGAALARAQRQSAAILPSEGQKIVF